MSVLTKEKILEEIKRGNIKIEPFNPDDVGPGSVDLTLGNVFRVFKKQNKIFYVTNEADFEKVTEVIEIKDYYLLQPGETIFGITQEKITLAPNLCGWLEGRSRFARLGLMVHISASFMQPGIANCQVLEITNLSPIPLALHPGTKICQFIFQRCEGEAKYQGRFKEQQTP